WFINQSHAHPIDGIKTQSIDSSRTGEATKDSLINGYNQLMFDAHPDSPQINVYSSSFQSSLTIGHLYQHSDHTRGQARGQGISIETQAAANVQGSTGIHISSQASDPLSKSHMSHDSHSKLQTADQHQQAYAQLADTHQPVGLEGSSNNKSNSKEERQTPFAQFSEDTNDSSLDESGQWQQAHLLIDSQRHLALLSGQHSQHTSTQSTHSHATDSTHHHSQTQMNQLAAGDIHYYSNKAQTHTAAHGDVTIQAHQAQMRLDSEQVLRIHSRDSIEIIAPDTLTLKAAGSGIEISGGNVTFITPAQVGYKASKVEWGSGGGDSPTITMPQNELADCVAKAEGAGNKGGAV
ncbi:MAG: type VI secretion system tip protein VgrG, partial [Psychrobacter sp.]|nr:type VI secretion system tip protein VgrG [Psychrobacter sp.]